MEVKNAYFFNWKDTHLTQYRIKATSDSINTNKQKIVYVKCFSRPTETFDVDYFPSMNILIGGTENSHDQWYQPNLLG